MVPHKLFGGKTVSRDCRNRVKEVSKGERLAIHNVFIFWGCPVDATTVTLIQTKFILPRIKAGFWHRTFDHFPGECIKFDGSK